ncbi:MAG: 23S rRNA (pseudouridine(1915)-N(3))-methyltransferase RlmH [Syntrophomonas sp.]|nr:23S rRNA (pseudouridine(1915)-N(3))-methyltransferase RlmH [Syntrophomonas sp.]
MKYRIISVGKIRTRFFSEGVNEYIKRLTLYTDIELLDGLEEKISPRAGEKDIEKVLHKEGERILGLLRENDILVVLDNMGKVLSSEELALYIENWNISGRNRVNMVIGGAHGLADIVKKRADCSISFSRMTFPHQMAALILCEQIYRGFKILKNEPYHH